jgi:hypothetical protein
LLSDEILELERLKEARLDSMFPDEVDTPMDTLARYSVLRIPSKSYFFPDPSSELHLIRI